MPRPISACRAALVGLVLAWSAAYAQPLAGASSPLAESSGAVVIDARDAARKQDRSRLAADMAAAQAAHDPLLSWIEYWDLASRLDDAQADEVDAFLRRWSGTYVEDRLRNDWLLQLGKRRDFAAIAREYPRFRMNDDREVTCWFLLAEHLAGHDVRDAARAAWFAQRDVDDGCTMLATAMVDAGRFSADDVWTKARLAVEAGRPAAARTAVGLLGGAAGREIAEAIDSPARFLRRPRSPTHGAQELRALAYARLAASDPAEAAAGLAAAPRPLSPPLLAWAWAYTGRQAALRLSADAPAYYQHAWAQVKADPNWSDDTLAWNVRASLRSARPADRWPQVIRAIDAMSAAAQRDPAWIYWKARALLATAAAGEGGEPRRAEARRMLAAIASPVGYYGQLAAEELGTPLRLPAEPPPPSAAERDAARTTPGLQRALLLVALGLRDEARREWNYTLRGMNERQLLAAAQLACDQADWQLCINTAERSKQIDVALRYPTPFAIEITQAASQAGLDPAFVFGLIRQETRFMPQLKSAAGAIGLMQVLPATGRWVAKKIGADLGASVARLADPLVNLRLGTSYLKLVLDDLGGSQALAAAAYNAGPRRPRRWRDGPVLETPIWAENVPFNETRDYVKKVLSNAAVYAALLSGTEVAVLKPRLGATIGPLDTGAPAANADLP